MRSNNRPWSARFKSVFNLSRSAAKRISRAVIDELEPRQLMHGVTSFTPYNGQQQVAVGANITVTFDSAMSESTINTNTFQLRDASNNLVAASISYNATTRVATLDPTANLQAAGTYYYVKLIGGAGGVADAAGDPLHHNYDFAFTTGTPTFNDTTVISGLVAPSAVKFAPDGRVFVAEKSGIIKVYDSVNDTTPDVFADLRTQVHNFWDRGLLGLAIDPGFNTGRPYVYALYTYDAPLGSTAPTYGTVGGTSDSGGSSPTGTGAVVSGRLVRLTASGNVAVPGSELVLISDWAQQFPSHSIGDMNFGADGYLYVSAGDGASFTFADYGQTAGINDPTNEGGALRSQDVRSTGDPTGLSGSVIRIDPNTGAAAPGNPNTTGDANAQRIIAYGMRNPFRFTFRPGTNELWIGDVGWNSSEEIDRIISPTDSVIENFGWPAYEGNLRQSGYDNLNLNLLESLYTDANGHTLPYFTYSHSSKVVAGSAEPTGGSSISGLAFYNGGTYPSAFDGALFFADYSRKQIYVMYEGANGLPDPNTRQIFKSQANGSVYLTTGPNGDLYYVDMDLGRIGRFTFNSNNAAPTADFTATPPSGASPLSVAFNAASSTDPDAGDTLTYAWDLDGDGNFNDSTVIAPSYVYNTSGTRTVKLRVTDRGGLTDVSSKIITVNGASNTAPTPVINSPLGSLNWKVGDTITFSGGASDTEDGTLAASSLSWTLAMIHASAVDPTSQHTHVIQTYSGVASGSFQAPDHEYPSWLELRLTATDSEGLSTTSVLRLDPATSAITVTSNLSGVALTLNSETLVGPFVRSVIVGGGNSVGAPSTMNVGGVDYIFSGWSDGGAITHNFTGPTTNLVLTANYTQANPDIKLTGAIIGTTGSFQGLGNTIDKAFDGNFATHFDGPEGLGNGMWLGLDLGAARRISMVRYVPRANNENRMIGGKFQGSNTADFSAGVVDLFTIAAPPTSGQYTSSLVSDLGTFRYVRYLSPDGGYGNVAEVEFYAPPGSVTLPAAPTNLAATPVSTTRVDLTWTDVADDETGIKVERKTGAAGTWATIGTLSAPNQIAYSDTTAVANTLYYYRVRSNNAAGDSAASNEIAATTPTVNPAPVKLTGTIIGTTGSYSNSVNTREKVFDGSLSTFFDGPQASNGNGIWAGLDLGTAQRINEIKFAPRTGWASRMVGGKFQGSNSSTFASGVVDLYTITSTPAQGALITIAVSNPNTFQYVRYLSPNGGWGNVAEVEFYTNAVTPPPAVPNAPTGLVATPVSTTQINLTWTDNAANETGFRIERKTGAAGVWATLITVNTPDTTSYSDTALSASTQYFYRVYAINANGESIVSNEASATTAAVPVAPTAPSNLLATPVSVTQVNLTWTDTADNETGFRIERKTGLAGTWATHATINTPNTASYSDTTNVVASTQYYYRVFAINAVGDSAASAEANATTPPADTTTGNVVRELWTGISGTNVTSIPVNNPPTSTSLLTTLEIPNNANGTNWGSRIRGYIVAPASGSYVFWIASDDRSELYLSTTASPANKVKIASVTGYTTSRQWTKYSTQKSVAITLVAGQQYYFEILHKQGTSGSNLAVGWAKPGQATTAPSEIIGGAVLSQYVPPVVTITAPTALTAVAQPAGSILLNWTDNATNEAGYKIERSVGGGAYVEIATVGANINTYTNIGLTASTQYSYRVRGYSGTVFSSYSAVASATTVPAAVVTTYLSDLPFAITPINGWGPVELDQSVGEQEAGDGGVLTLNGVTYTKGLGVHANSEITYNLAGQYQNFLADIGIDDESGVNGSVVFQVWVDGVQVFDSGLMTGASLTQAVNISVVGKNQLKLIVTNGGDNLDADHGDWANARLTN